MSKWHVIDGLRLAAASSRRNQFLMEILETQLPGVHFHDVDDEVEVEVEVSPTPLSPQMLNAGSPRLVDGARESHIVLGYQQTMREWGSDHAAMTILAQGSNGDRASSARSGEFEESFSEAADAVVGDLSHSRCLEFLGRNGPNLLMGNILKDKDTICLMLLNMAENVEVLPPGNEPLPWDVLSMSLWKASLGELIKEMKTVEEKCPSLTGNPGVYVLTTSSYSAFLRALAVEIADCRHS